MSSERHEVVIVGAGIIGLSAAYHIASTSPLNVLVVEQNNGPGMGATAKATGGFRQQFPTPLNIMLSRLSLEEYEGFEELTGQELPIRKHGYLFVTTSHQTLESMAQNVALQNSLGVPSRVVDPNEIRRLVPFARVDDLVGGTFCPDDGSAAPADALNGYRRRARELGVAIQYEAQVTGLAMEGGAVAGVATANGIHRAAKVVNAAGVGAIDLAASAGYELPARPYRRQVFLTEPVPELAPDTPFFVDIDTGWYVHREMSGTLILGGTDAVSRPGTEEVVDWDHFEVLADAALTRIPELFDRLRVRDGLCGVRMLTPDQHPLIGVVADIPNLICATACNGHGFMHAPAAGQLIAETVVDGKPSTLDAELLSPDRFNATDRVESIVF